MPRRGGVPEARAPRALALGGRRWAIVADVPAADYSPDAVRSRLRQSGMGERMRPGPRAGFRGARRLPRGGSDASVRRLPRRAIAPPAAATQRWPAQSDAGGAARTASNAACASRPSARCARCADARTVNRRSCERARRACVVRCGPDARTGSRRGRLVRELTALAERVTQPRTRPPASADAPAISPVPGRSKEPAAVRRRRRVAGGVAARPRPRGDAARPASRIQLRLTCHSLPSPQVAHPPAPPTTTGPSLAATLVGAGDPEPSLLDLVDSLLHKGVVVDAELVIALADVDLLYVRLGAARRAPWIGSFGAAPAPRVTPSKARR